MLGMILPRERLYFLLLQYTLRSLESVSMKSGQSGCHMQSAADENRHDSLLGGGRRLQRDNKLLVSTAEIRAFGEVAVIRGKERKMLPRHTSKNVCWYFCLNFAIPHKSVLQSKTRAHFYVRAKIRTDLCSAERKKKKSRLLPLPAQKARFSFSSHMAAHKLEQKVSLAGI